MPVKLFRKTIRFRDRVPRRLLEVDAGDWEDDDSDDVVDTETEEVAVTEAAAVCVDELYEFSDFLMHNLMPVLFSLICSDRQAVDAGHGLRRKAEK